MLRIGVSPSSKVAAQALYWDIDKVNDLDLYFDAAKGGIQKDGIGYITAGDVIVDTHADAHLVPEALGSWTSKAANVLCYGTGGLQVLPASATNHLRNNSMAGAVVGVVGSGGSLPTNWAAFGGTIATEVVALGTVNGLPYIDIKITGSPTSNGLLNFGSTSEMAAAEGQTWTHGFWATVIAGTLTNVTSLNASISWRNGSSSFISISTGSDFKEAATLTRTTITATAPATTGFLLPQVLLNCPGAVNFTLRIVAPQSEQSPFATPPILTSSAAVTKLGNVQKVLLPAGAQAGVGGFWHGDIKAAVHGSHLINFSPSTQVNQALMDAANDLGAVTPGIKTYVFAASPGYTRLQALAGPTVAAVTGDWQNNVAQLSFGGNGFNTDNNGYLLTKKFGLMYGAMNDSEFTNLIDIATASINM